MRTACTFNSFESWFYWSPPDTLSPSTSTSTPKQAQSISSSSSPKIAYSDGLHGRNISQDFQWADGLKATGVEHILIDHISQKVNNSPTISSVMFHNFSAVTYDEAPLSRHEFDLNSGLTGSELCGAIWTFASTQSDRYAPDLSRGLKHQRLPLCKNHH